MRAPTGDQQSHMTAMVPISVPPVHPDSQPAGPIKSVSVVSTGTVRIHPQQPLGTRVPMMVWLFGSRTWTPPVPINAYVIEHSNGLVLFDTGQDRASVTDRDYFPGGVIGFLYGRLARFQIAPNDTLVEKLAAAGHDASEVQLVLLSHLHQDHIGGIKYLPKAEFVVTDAEWSSLQEPRPEIRGLMPKHIDVPGVRYRRIQFQPTNDPEFAPFTASHDVMGDGSLVLLPTPGHTPGSMSLLVRRPGKVPLLMVGDLTYEAERLEAGKIPGVGDKAGMRTSSSKIRALMAHHPGLAILPAHDPGAADRLRLANGA
jgi:N-acyl homoserine lactone hydrolase